MTDKCSICLEELVDDIGVAVPCGHCFHRDCFARLKAAANNNCNGRFRTATKCCVCKRKVKKFHKVYLNVSSSQCNPVEEKKTQESIAAMKEEDDRLQKRLEELEALSNDQSDLLFRILPRYDKLESRCSHMKRENRNLHKRVEALKYENFERRAKLSRTEEQLEEAEGENTDLHAIWDILEDRLETFTHSVEKKRSKRKVKKRSRSEFKADKKRFDAVLTETHDEEVAQHKKRRRVSFDSSSS